MLSTSLSTQLKTLKEQNVMKKLDVSQPPSSLLFSTTVSRTVDIDLLYTKEDFENYFNLCKKSITEEITILDEGIGHQGEASVIRVVIQKN